MNIQQYHTLKFNVSRRELVDFIVAHIAKTHDVEGMTIGDISLTADGFSVEFYNGNTINDLKFDTGNR